MLQNYKKAYSWHIKKSTPVCFPGVLAKKEGLGSGTFGEGVHFPLGTTPFPFPSSAADEEAWLQ